MSPKKISLMVFSIQIYDNICSQTPSKLSTVESTQAHRGDCQDMYREAPGDQQLFGVLPRTQLKCPSD